MAAREKLSNGIPLLSDAEITFLSVIEAGSSTLELNGGLGIVSEHLSATCRTKLCDDGRLYFTYRRQIFPKSSVIEMNISPYALSTSIRISDFVIIHNPEFLEIARKLAKKFIVVMYEKAIISVYTKEENETVDINSVKNTGAVTKNSSNKTVAPEQPTSDNTIHNDELPKSNGDANLDNADNKSVLDME
jgi:hypothetical protein